MADRIGFTSFRPISLTCGTPRTVGLTGRPGRVHLVAKEGLRPGPSPGFASGRVVRAAIGTDPGVGAVRPAGSTVTIFLSTGGG